MSIKKYLEKSAESVDTSALEEILENDGSLINREGSSINPALYYALAALPFAGRGAGRMVRGGLHRMGNKIGFNPVLNYQARRSMMSPQRYLSQNAVARSQALQDLSTKNIFINNPFARLRTEGQFAPKVFGGSKKLDRLTSILMPKDKVTGAPVNNLTTNLVSGTGLTLGTMGALSDDYAQMRADQNANMYELENAGNNYVNQVQDKLNKSINKARMPGLAGAAIGTGIGALAGSSISSKERKERVRKLAQMRGISEEEAEKLVSEGSGLSSYLGAGLGGIGGYLLANKMYPIEDALVEQVGEVPITKESRNQFLDNIPSGQGPQQMANALSMLEQARALVRPADSELSKRNLIRSEFEDTIDELSEKEEDRYEVRKLRASPKKRSLFGGLAGALAGGLLGVAGNSNRSPLEKITSPLAGVALGGGAGALAGYLSAKSKNRKLKGTLEVLKDSGLLKPEHLRRAKPLLKG